MSLRRILTLAVVALLLGCSRTAVGTAQNGRINVVTTISTFNSFVEAVGGSRVSVTSLVPIGGSPETYQPTPQNVATLAQAQLLIENGAGLETWLDRTIHNAGSSTLRVVTCTDGLPIIKGNPHLWMDPQFAKRYVLKIRDALTNIDPIHANEYRRNARKYNEQLDRLTQEIASKIGVLPRERRVMIVFHNAWQYYNDRFGITTLGSIEPSPGQEPNPQSLAQLVDLAKAHHVRAIFGEPEYSPKLAQQLAHSAGISIVSNLYDDSLGTDWHIRDYIAMLRYDTEVIVAAMQ